MAKPESIVFYDGDCILCQFVVKRLIKLDTDGLLHYAPLQGETAKTFGIEWDSTTPPSAQTVKFVDNRGPQPVVYDRVRAARAALETIQRARPLAALLRIVPLPISNAIYRLVAAGRYRLLGTNPACPIPPAAVRARFLP